MKQSTEHANSKQILLGVTVDLMNGTKFELRIKILISLVNCIYSCHLYSLAESD